MRCSMLPDKLMAEQLFRSAADCPSLHAGLRSQVMTAFIEARHRRTARRRIFTAACLLISIVGLVLSNRAASQAILHWSAFGLNPQGAGDRNSTAHAAYAD